MIILLNVRLRKGGQYNMNTYIVIDFHKYKSFLIPISKIKFQ